jgi:ABC-type amino acid transport substrate-binding protein
MKSIVSAWAGACLALMISTSGLHAECLDDIKQAGVLNAGSGVMGMRPYIWYNDDRSYTGFEADLLQELGKRMGIAKTEFTTTEWPTLIPGLKAKRWDIILSGMAVTQERIQGAGITFTRPYFMLYDYVTVLDSSPIKSVEDLKGKTLASMIGTLDSLNAHNLVDDGKAAKVLDFNASTEAYKAMRNGQVDAIVLSQATLIAQQGMMHDVHSFGDPIYYHAKPEWAEAEAKAPYRMGSVAIGLRNGCPALLQALNTALEGMDEDGTRKAILTKYGIWADFQGKLMK